MAKKHWSVTVTLTKLGTTDGTTGSSHSFVADASCSGYVIGSVLKKNKKGNWKVYKKQKIYLSSHRASWTYTWSYDFPMASGGSKRITASSGTDKTYSAPDGATRVYCTVACNSKKDKRRLSGKQKAKAIDYWYKSKKRGSSIAVTDAPTKPTITTIELTELVDLSDADKSLYGRKFYVKCDNLDISIKTLNFDFLADDKTNQTVVGTPVKIQSADKATVISSSIKVEYTGNVGSYYKVRVQGVGANGAKTEYSDWSDTIYMKTLPITSITKTPKSPTSIFFTWTLPSNADHCLIERATSEWDLLNSGESYTAVEVGSKLSSIVISNLTAGVIWYFRFKAVNPSGIGSDWSDILQVNLGTKPSAPTTWSDVTVASLSDIVKLYWIHNSEDDSLERYFNLVGLVDDVEVFNIVKENKKETITIDGVDITEYSDETNLYELDLTKSTSEYDGNTSSPYVFKDSDELVWEVRTKGILDEYGDFSTTRSVKIFEPPSLTVGVLNQELTNSISVVDSYPINIQLASRPASQSPIGFGVTITAQSQYVTNKADGTEALINSGDEVYSKYIDVPSDDLIDYHDYLLALNPGDIDLEDGVSYKILATIAMNSGLSASCENTFSAAWSDEKYDVFADIIFDEDTLSTVITPFAITSFDAAFSYLVDRNGKYLCDSAESIFAIPVPAAVEVTDEDETETITIIDDVVDPSELTTNDVDSDLGIDIEDLETNVTLSIYRKQSNGEFLLIASGLENTAVTSITDPHPSFEKASYRVIAVANDTGSMSFDDFDLDIDYTSIVIQWNESIYEENAFGEENVAVQMLSATKLILPYNIDVSESSSLDASLISYVGRERPVSYYGTQLGEKPSWSCDIPKDDTDTISKLRKLAAYPGDVYVREPSGTGYWANINISLDIKHKDTIIPVKLSITPVEGGI